MLRTIITRARMQCQSIVRFLSHRGRQQLGESQGGSVESIRRPTLRTQHQCKLTPPLCNKLQNLHGLSHWIHLLCSHKSSISIPPSVEENSAPRLHTIKYCVEKADPYSDLDAEDLFEGKVKPVTQEFIEHFKK